MIVPAIAYVRVDDLEYPRNALLRATLAERGSVRVVVRTRRGNVLARYLRDLVATWQASAGVDVILVAEFSLPFVPIAWCIARARRARLVVDCFVGRHETVIGDWATSSPRSLRSAVARLVDRIAVRLADLVLIDTETRADRLRELYGVRGPQVLPIAVGAPSWATTLVDRPVRDVREPLRVLYYGWYIPLHGVPTIIEALAGTRQQVELTLVGEAEHTGGVSDMRVMARNLGVATRCRFLASGVGTDTLAELVTEADVVLGVFGASEKAAGVIPNKVWQGLAMGRVVVTRRSSALADLEDVLPGGQLITVPPQDPTALARVLDTIGCAPRRTFPETRRIVDELVARDLGAMIAAIDALSRRD